MNNDTIAALATPPGRGGVGIIRISGKKTLEIAKKILQLTPKNRYAHYSCFYSAKNTVLDQGIALFFSNPHSFTGEDVLELQGHGGPIVLNLILKEVLSLGARMAHPGEFSERAFLNDKIDLAQAESIADLINASSEQAAKQAVNSLQGMFSKTINILNQQIIQLRMYVESAIDFPEEEIDFLSDGKVLKDLEKIIAQTNNILHQTKQGVLLREGMKVVIAGRPNAGKSSLLNLLAQRDAAIVTDIAGTTRDIIREHIHIDGMPLHIVDTAGLRESDDHVEKAGIEKARQEIYSADCILLIIDVTDASQNNVTEYWQEFFKNDQLREKIILVFNKIDKKKTGNELIASEKKATHDIEKQTPAIYLSAKTGKGVESLKQHLKTNMGYQGTTETGFIARERHLQAIKNAQVFLIEGREQLQNSAAGELLAEDLKMAQDKLSEITGKFTPDDLLGEIFSNFCIGK